MIKNKRKKIKKLLTNPKGYLQGFIRNKQKKYFPKKVFGEDKYTVVSAVYGVESYLDDYFKSLVNQTLDFKQHIHLVVVDYGKSQTSTDTIKKWKSQYPDNISHVMEDKKIPQSTTTFNSFSSYIFTEWITFINSNDLVDEEYFEEIDLFFKKNTIDILNSKKTVYNIKKKKFLDNHPLKYQFNTEKNVISNKINENFLVSLSSLTLNKNTFKKLSNLTFNIVSLLDFLAKNPDIKIGFSTKAIYKERVDDGVIKHVGDLYKNIEKYFDLIERTKKSAWIENQVIYFVFECIKQFMLDNKLETTLNKHEKEIILNNLYKLMNYVSVDKISKFKRSGFNFKYRVGFLDYFKNAETNFQILYIQDYDKEKKLLQINYFSPLNEQVEDFIISDKRIIPTFHKRRVYQLMNRNFVCEQIIHIYIEDFNEILKASINNKEVRFSLFGKQYKKEIPLNVIGDKFLLPKVEEFSISSYLIKSMANSKKYKDKYRNTWLLMDKDSMADDNAEHLYRYILENRKDINAFFLLDSSCSDWDRLKKEDFRLIKFGSVEHKIALLNATNILSSHAAPFVVSYLDNKFYKNHLNFKFTFLQHGVTKDNISRWMNSRKVDCFIATSEDEYSSIAGNLNTYKMTPKEVALTGFSRHDTLLSLPIKTDKMIMVMPTWRLFLAGELKKTSGTRSLNPDFYTSEFALSWKSFLHSNRLKNLSVQYGYKIVFYPHPNILPYLEWFDLPDHIELIQANAKKSIQYFFKKSSFMVTDYSSVAFDMAFLNKPVIYYHFDAVEFFSGVHSYSKGYYDYEKDGFGPVAYKEIDLLDNIETLLLNKNIIEKKYQLNIDKAFKFRDGKSSERIVDAVINLHESKHKNKNKINEILKSTIVALKHGNWVIVEDRLSRLESVHITSNKLCVELIKSKIYVGKLEEARELINVYKFKVSKNILDHLSISINNYEYLFKYKKELFRDNTSLEITFDKIEHWFKSKHWEALNVAYNLIDINNIEEDRLHKYYYILGRTKRALGENTAALDAYAKSLSYNKKPNDPLMQYATLLYEEYDNEEVTDTLILKPFKKNGYKIESVNMDLIEHWFKSEYWEGLNVAIVFLCRDKLDKKSISRLSFIEGYLNSTNNYS